MSFLSRFIVWIGRLYTGFNLHNDSLPSQNCSSDLLTNHETSSNGHSNKKSNGHKIIPSKNGSKDTNDNQLNLSAYVHLISVQFNWPVFTVVISLSQFACFILGNMYSNNGWISESNFEANHLKRYEFWRIITSLFVHDGGLHLFASLLDQMITGCCLEIVHGWKPVLLVYFGGALIADLGDLLGETGIYGCGASGAISALYAGNLASVILNWNETSGAVIRTIILLIALFGIVTGPYWYPIAVTVFGPDIEYLFGAVLDNDVSHAAHMGGVLGGFVFGICLLKKFQKRSWKNQLTKMCGCIAIVLVIVGIVSLFYNPLFYSKEFLRSKMNGNNYEL